jgi:3-dehydroquinate dehydratase-2
MRLEVTMKLLILNGPNLNLLGSREPEIYGTESLKDIELSTMKIHNKVEAAWRQSNSENELISWVQNANNEGFSGIIINPGAFTHTSVALRDALANFSGVKVEVHLSNTYKREKFRKTKLTSEVCDGIIEGLGSIGYRLAIESIL